MEPCTILGEKADEQGAPSGAPNQGVRLVAAKSNRHILGPTPFFYVLLSALFVKLSHEPFLTRHQKNVHFLSLGNAHVTLASPL